MQLAAGQLLQHVAVHLDDVRVVLDDEHTIALVLCVGRMAVCSCRTQDVTQFPPVLLALHANADARRLIGARWPHPGHGSADFYRIQQSRERKCEPDLVPHDEGLVRLDEQALVGQVLRHVAGLAPVRVVHSQHGRDAGVLALVLWTRVHNKGLKSLGNLLMATQCSFEGLC